MRTRRSITIGASILQQRFRPSHIDIRPAVRTYSSFRNYSVEISRVVNGKEQGVPTIVDGFRASSPEAAEKQVRDSLRVRALSY